MYQFIYEYDDIKYPYTARNYDGAMYGFKNLPVRNFDLKIWLDSVTGEPGELILFDQWDNSMRITAELADLRKVGDRRWTVTRTPDGKRGSKFKRKGGPI